MMELARDRAVPVEPVPLWPVTRVRVVSFAVVLATMLASMVVVDKVVVDTVAAAPSLINVKLLVGSENEPFFEDAQVKDVFAQQGLQLDVRYLGSRQMAKEPRLCEDFDLVMPSSSPAADKIKEICDTRNEPRIYKTPMVILTFDKIAAALRAAGIAEQDDTTKAWTFDLEKYLTDIVRISGSGDTPAGPGSLTWEAMPENTTYESPRTALVTTTDPRLSNSAEMYVAATSYLLNNKTTITKQDEVDRLAPIIGQRLFLDQGYTSGGSQHPFEDYLGSLGESQIPMLWAYESQFLEVAINHPELLADRVIMYTSQTVIADHTAISLTEHGDRVAQLLGSDDETVHRLKTQHGFRTYEQQEPFTDVDGKPITVISNPSVPQMPRYEILEALLQRIEEMYRVR